MSTISDQALTEATSILYASLLADDELSPFFEGMDVVRIEQRQAQFLRIAMLGEDPGVDLRKVHAPLLARGLNHNHFDRMTHHLANALEEVGVAADAIEIALDRVESFRQAVLGETYTHSQVKEQKMFGRITSMIYAFVCYTVGMAVLAYSAAWMGGFLLPVTLDTPAQFTVLGLIINLGLVALFGIQHSVMARPAFKQQWTKIIPAHCERATYVLASSIAMFVMMYFWQPLGVDIWRVDGTAQVVLYSLFGFGWFILVSSTFFLNHFDLFGLRQAWLNLRGKPYTHIPFRTPGYYRLVRHPIYVGWLTLIWATPTMTISHLVFALATTAYILIAIPMEEKDLENMLPEYQGYKESTPALVPGMKAGVKPLNARA